MEAAEIAVERARPGIGDDRHRYGALNFCAAACPAR
jgi:hypothetical protein